MSARIFLIEDNLVIRQMMVEALTEMVGATIVGWADSESQAVDAMRGCQWTIALVDLFLREGSGLGVARAFQKRHADQRLYVVTNYPTLPMREACIKLGVDRMYDKSTELDALFDAIRLQAPGTPRAP